MTVGEAFAEAVQATIDADRPDLLERLLAEMSEAMLGIPQREPEQ